MTNKFLIGIGVSFLFVFALGIAAVVGINSLSEQTTVISDPATTKPAIAFLPAPPSLVPEAQAQDQPAPVVSPVLPTAAFPAVIPVPVLDSDLASLAAAVKLGGSNTGDAGKEVWARETPIAKKLLRGLCDCDQRNWLNHFVKTGNEAMSGSEDFYQSVQLLAKLRRNNQELSVTQASR
jgi:hypothetical protein